MQTKWSFTASFALLLGCLGSTWLVGQVPAKQTENSSPVSIYVTIFGPHGANATPDPKMFDVSVDKSQAQSVSLHDGSKDALMYAVLVDASGSNYKIGDLIRRAAVKIFEDLSATGARGYLIVFKDGMERSRQPVSATQVASVLNGITFHGGTAIFDTIQMTCTTILSRKANSGNPRRIIVLISDGDDNSSRLRSVDAEEFAQNEGVAIFTLATSRWQRGSDSEHGGKKLDLLSRTTGGWPIFSRDPEDGVSKLVSAINEQWALSFVPLANRDGHLHKLKVKSWQKGIDISAPDQVPLQ